MRCDLILVSMPWSSPSSFWEVAWIQSCHAPNPSDLPISLPPLALPGVDVVLGCNGLLWVAPHRAPRGDDDAPPAHGGPAGDAAMSEADAQQGPSRQQLEAVARVGGVLRALSRLYLPIYAASITGAYDVRACLHAAVCVWKATICVALVPFQKPQACAQAHGLLNADQCMACLHGGLERP